MEFSVPGFIKKFCTPNAILTLAEYIVDYATESTARKGWQVIERNLNEMDDKYLPEVRNRIERIKQGERDLYF
jgi:2-iminoacetate synthase